MTTYTLTQAQYDELHGTFANRDILRILKSLKPNSQEPVAEVHEHGRSISITEIEKGVLAHGQKLFLRPAPISKEDMVKVLEALQSEVNNYEEDDPEDGAPENLYDARRIMQSAIEGMK
jgi:hypothetical protein